MNAPAPLSSGRRPMIWIGLLAVVLLAGLIAVIASQGGDDDTDDVAAGDDQTTVEVQSTDDGETAAEPEGPGDDAPCTLASDADGSGAVQALPPLAEGDDPAVGCVVPTVRGIAFDGADLAIGPDGTAKVVVFVAHWCPHCQAEVPVIAEHLADSPLPEGVEVVTVSTSVEPEADNYPPQAWLAREGWPARTLPDDDASSVAAAYGVSSFPFFVAFDADGVVVERTSGEIGTDRFDELVEAALAG